MVMEEREGYGRLGKPSPPSRRLLQSEPTTREVDQGAPGGYSRLDSHSRATSGGAGGAVEGGQEMYGRLEHNMMEGSSPAPEYSSLGEAYGKLQRKSPSPGAKRKIPPSCPTPYRPRPGSPMATLLSNTNPQISENSDPHSAGGEGAEENTYSTLKTGPFSSPTLCPPGAPSVDNEGYGWLRHGSHAPNHTPLPLAALQVPQYSQLSVRGAQSATDPPSTGADGPSSEEAPLDPDYSTPQMAQLAPPPPDVDSTGYSRPWTSFSLTPTPLASLLHNTPLAPPATNGHPHKQGGSVEKGHDDPPSSSGGPLAPVRRKKVSPSVPPRGGGKSFPLVPRRQGASKPNSDSEPAGPPRKPIPPPKPHVEIN